MKGLPEHQDQLPELQKKPEEPKPADEGWKTIKPGIQQNNQGQMRTDLPVRPIWYFGPRHYWGPI